MKKLKRAKKVEELSREDFERDETIEEVGEFRHRPRTGKHLLGKNTNFKIKGKRYKRISQSGDILICPPRLIASFHDKFERIDILPEAVLPPEKQLKRVHKGGGRYDVINTVSGVKLNNDFLTKDEANELIVSDNAPPEEDNIE
jgi:hypothetical protein